MKKGLAPLALCILVLALSGLPAGSQAAGKAAVREGSISGSGWGSGWIPLSRNNPVTLQHGLGGDLEEYALQMWFWDTDDGFGINNRAYGGLEEGGVYYGAYWQKLTESDVEITRSSGDDFVDEVRIWIWVPGHPPEYCSDWTNIAKGGSVLFGHNLGGDVDDYVVGLWFESGNAAYGVNQHGYGGMEAGEAYMGAWWTDLTDSEVRVRRAANDPFADWVRVCVGFAEPTAYDSGWVDVAPDQTLSLQHGLGHSVSGYVVRMEFKDTAGGGIGIHHENAGGNAVGDSFLGANWQNLTTSTISVYRLQDDATVDQVRIRIWQRAFGVYMPVVMRD